MRDKQTTLSKNKKNMKTLNINLNGRNLIAKIEVLTMGVFINTEFDGRKRATSYNSIEEAIQNTTLIPVKNFLKSL